MALGWPLVLALSLLIGCAPGLKNPTTCQMGGVPVEVEEGAITPPQQPTTFGGPSAPPQDLCTYVTGMLGHYRGLFEDRFGHAAWKRSAGPSASGPTAAFRAGALPA